MVECRIKICSPSTVAVRAIHKFKLIAKYCGSKPVLGTSTNILELRTIAIKKNLMDFISHIFVGKIFQTASNLNSLKARTIVITFAFLPDIPVGFIYLLLGRANNRPFWIPYNSDWIGVRETHPWWAATWEIPHSLFFGVLFIIPLVLYLNWPKIAIVSYFSHILLDLFTHTGEWGVKPFYPFNYIVNGFTDAWAWPLCYMMISWIILSMMIFVAQQIAKNRGKTIRSKFESANYEKADDLRI